MVKYYGRAKQRIGSVNTNQIGINMSGCPSKVGRQGYLTRYIGRRTQCNQKFCGPVFYHGVIWKWNNGPGRCVAKAPRGQSFNSGVGHKSTPRFACGDTCEVGLDALTAVRILQEYFKIKYNGQGSLILVAKKETLKSDSIPNQEDFAQIKHFYPGTPEYKELPVREQQAVEVLNNLNIMGKLNKNSSPVPHVVGYTSFKTQKILREYGFGQSGPAFGPRKGDSVRMFCFWDVFCPGENSYQQDMNQNEQMYNDGLNEGAEWGG
jgi:hypothetical protein